MPPTDCFEGTADACIPDLNQVMGPAARSPMHHGTDPDLSAATLLPAGVAATGLDLSPATSSRSFHGGAGRVGVSPLQAVAMAKRKQRSAPHMACTNSTCNAALSPTARSARGFSKNEPLHARHPKRAAMQTCSGQHVTTLPGGRLQQQSAGREVASGEKSKDVGAETEEFSDDEAGEGPPGFEPLVVGGRGSKPTLLGSSACVSRNDDATDTEPATPESDVGDRTEDAEIRSQERAATPSTTSGKDIQEVMAKATKAAAHIRLLLHAKRCQGNGCRERGCEAARQLVVHMHGCAGGVCKPTCVQARRLLSHYAECSRKRAQLGSGYCLVCSLVARSATHGNHNHTSNNHPYPSCNSHNSNNRCCLNAPHSRSFKLSRTPLGYLGPGVPPSRYADGYCGGNRSPVGISRLRRGDLGQGQGQGLAASVGVSGGLGQGIGRARGTIGGRQKDGVFFRPLPCKGRSGSWGGYDRRRLMRRTRFDSIPEGLAEEEDDDLDQETASEGGSDSVDESARSNNDTRSTLSKTFMSSHSL